MEIQRPAAVVAVLAAFMLAQVPFSLGEWVSAVPAPDESGIYNVIIRATYNGVVGTFPLELRVGPSEYSNSGLSVEPMYPLDKITPIELTYDIKLNGSSDFSMTSSNITLYYVSGDTILSSQEGGLSLEEDGYWHATVDVPFRGDYKAVVSLSVQKAGKYYGGRFISYFKADGVSNELLLDPFIDKKILTPMESFSIGMEASFKDHVLPGLKIFKANLLGNSKVLGWGQQDQSYKTQFTAPNNEGVYILGVYAEGQGFVSLQKIYVADISKAKAGRCPLDAGSACTDMKDVRKCVSDYKSGMFIGEDSLVQCFESATKGVTSSNIICNGQQKGNFDGDKVLSANDLDILQNMILPLSANMREDYVKCADYDRNGNINEQDLKCLTNVVAGKWPGDFNGGICLDLVYDSPLKCDLNSDQFIRQDDAKLMKKLIDLANVGITMPQEVLDTCDFNRDKRIGQEDGVCLGYFVGMDFDNPDTLLGGGQTIPERCMRIYQLDRCQSIRGDLNGDLMINEIDEILVMLIERKQVTGYDMSCADVNEDNRISLEDVGCVKSYTAGDKEEYFVCIGCDENTPPEYRFRTEICGDGFDNDCDGLVDRTSLDPNEDKCRCTKKTPCWFVLDADGGVGPSIADRNVKVCRKMDWEEESSATIGGVAGYQWVDPSKLACGKDKECLSMYCLDSTFTCANNGAKWDWYDIGNQSLPGETDDPFDTPVTCDDGFDNNCAGGDKACVYPETNMFTSWQFWVGAILGAVVGWFLGPLYAMILGVILMVVQQFVKDPSITAFLSGFGLGMAVGNLAGSAASYLNAGKSVAGYGSLGKAITGGIKGALGIGSTSTPISQLGDFVTNPAVGGIC